MNPNDHTTWMIFQNKFKKNLDSNHLAAILPTLIRIHVIYTYMACVHTPIDEVKTEKCRITTATLKVQSAPVLWDTHAPFCHCGLVSV